MERDLDIRLATPQEIEPLAALWMRAWRDGHQGLVPEGLLKHRTEASFAARLARMGETLRVAGPVGDPLGFCAVKEAELYQLFVDRRARGTGLAQRLLADGEARIAANGFDLAILDCAPGNDRAAAFYRKCGWIFREETVWDVETEDGPFAMPAWVFEKRVG